MEPSKIKLQINYKVQTELVLIDGDKIETDKKRERRRRRRRTGKKEMVIELGVGNLEALSVDNSWARFVVFFLADPHGLEGGQ